MGANLLLKWLTTSFRNPVGLVVIGAIFAVCLSSYPIIFLGKSYVSPGYGPQMLYDGPPFVPGYRSMDQEDLSADAGAMPWQNLPYSRVQHQAVFEYGEFPLWNRYNSAGLPLFGQGQTQLLDPLQWIAVAGEGNGWAWDLKFLLSKLVFLAGIGACILLMTGNRFATFVITVSAAFIGFFYFRFNHPVYFNLTYAPWVFFGYLLWVRTIELNQRSTLKRPSVLPILIVFATSLLHLFGGTPKEGIILFGALHVAGLAGIAIASYVSRDLFRNMVVLIVLWVSIALATAPHWLIFLDTLSKSFTSYDVPNCNFASAPWQFIDTLFLGPQARPWSEPNLNMFIFISGLGALFVANRWIRYPYFWMILLPLAGLLGFAYGIVPNSICRQIPFIGVIHHIHHTFFTAAVVFAILLAGFGVKFLLLDLTHDKGRIKWVCYGVVVLVLLVWWAYPYYGQYEKVTSMAGRLAFIGIGGTTLLLLVAVWCYRSGQGYSKSAIILLVSLFAITHSYHGLHIRTGIVELDQLLINPTPRADFLRQSPTIAMLKFGGAGINQGFVPDRYVAFGNRAELIAEVLQIARKGGGYEKDIVLFENDLRRAINSSPSAAIAGAHVNNYLRGVGVRPGVLGTVLVVDDMPDKNQLDIFNTQLQTINSEPHRVIGIGRAPMSGFYSFLQLESLNGPDALMSSRYMELLDVLGWPRPPHETWLRTIKSNDITKLGPLMDLLNVGYFLSFRNDLNVLHLGSNTTNYNRPSDTWSMVNGVANLYLKHHPEMSIDRVGCAPRGLSADGKLDNVFSLELHSSDLGWVGSVVSAMSLEREVPSGLNHTGGQNYVLGVSLEEPTAPLLNNKNGEVRIGILSQTIKLWLFGCADGFDKSGTAYAAKVAVDRQPPIQRMIKKDMSVWKRESSWPRAFFVDSLAIYTELSEFSRFVRQAGGVPLAAVAGDRVVEPDVKRLVLPAERYDLTSNSTSFYLKAPGAGVVVLSEVNVPDDVHVWVNEQPGKVFNVNHAFRGVQIPKAGNYEITFTYRPELWTVALSLSVGGHLVLIIMLIFIWCAKKTNRSNYD